MYLNGILPNFPKYNVEGENKHEKYPPDKLWNDKHLKNAA